MEGDLEVKLLIRTSVPSKLEVIYEFNPANLEFTSASMFFEEWELQETLPDFAGIIHDENRHHSSDASSLDEVFASDSSQLEDAVVQTVRKKRKRYYDRRIKPFPRVFKRDIRRSYAIMLANTVNSSNTNLLLSFIQQFCSPDVEYTYSDATIANRTLAVGWRSLATLMAVSSRVVPDLTMTIDDIQIIQTLNEKGSAVQFSNISIGSKLYRIMEPNEKPDYIPTSCDLVLGDINRTLAATNHFNTNEILQLDTLLLPQFALVSRPMRNTAHWTVTLVVDEDNRITKLDYKQLSVEQVLIY